MDFYIDVFFCENLLLNYCVIALAAIMLRQRARCYRVFGAAVIGSVYACVAFIWGFENMYVQILMKLGVAVLMVVTAFRWCGGRMLLSRIIMFYSASFMFAGLLVAIQFLTGAGGEIVDGVVYWRSDFKIVNMIFGLMSVFLLVRAVVDFFRRKQSDELVVDCRVCMGEAEIELKAFMDTGNMLVEPFTGSPVVVVEKRFMRSLLGCESEALERGDFNAIGPEIRKRVKMVPFSAIGCQGGMLTGIQVDSMVIKGLPNAYKLKGVIIAFANEEMSFNGYNALMNPDLLKNA